MKEKNKKSYQILPESAGVSSGRRNSLQLQTWRMDTAEMIL